MGQKQHRRPHIGWLNQKIRPMAACTWVLCGRRWGGTNLLPSLWGRAGERAFGVYCDFGVQAAFKFSSSLSDGLNIGPKAV